MGQAHPALLEIFSHMVKGLYKKPQLISAFILETEIEIALRNARGPLRQSQNGGRELFGQAEAKPDGTEDGDHSQHAQNKQKRNLERLFELLQLSVFFEAL